MTTRMMRSLSTLAAMVAVYITACTSDKSDSADNVQPRSATTARQWHGEDHLNVNLQLAGGSLRVLPGRRERLYQITSMYDKAPPNNAYDPQRGTLSVHSMLSVGRSDKVTIGATGIKVHSQENGSGRSSTTLALSPAVAVDLNVTTLAMTTDVELGDLRLSSLAVETAAGHTTVRFSRPNTTTCAKAAITAGLSELSVVGLGNSRCAQASINGIAGRTLLDFSGDWPANTTMDVTIVAGALQLRLPRNVGVRLTQRNKLLADFTPNGLVWDGTAFVSPGYDRATRRLDIDVTTMVGGTSVEWLD